MQKILAILGLTLLCSASSYAIDQVVLSTGEIVEGKVLADVPNRHVDIQLVNGEKRRYPKSQVANVERDVPSNKDRDIYGSDKRIFFGPLLGGIMSLGSSGGPGAGGYTVADGKIFFMFGAKLGYNASNWGSAQFAPTLAYKRFSVSSTPDSISTNIISTQFNFRRISNTGFYVGPQIGIAFSSISGSTNANSSSFLGGITAGYDIQFNDSFSLGPDMQFDHFFASGGGNTVSFGLSAMFHFD